MSVENEKERKVIKINLDELNNVSGGDTYTELHQKLWKSGISAAFVAKISR